MNKNTLLAIGWPATVLGAFVAGEFSTPSSSPKPTEKANIAKVLSISRSSALHRPASTITGPTLRETRERVIAITEISESDFEKNFGIQRIMALSDPCHRADLLLSVMQHMDSDDFLTVIDDFLALGISKQRISEYQQLLHTWTKLDPYAALKHSKENNENHFAEKFILETWVKANPSAAIEWAETNFKGIEPNPYTQGLIKGLAPTNPALATQLLESLPFSKERHESLTFLIDQFSSENPETGFVWLASITDESLKKSATQRLVTALATEHPSSLAELVTSTESPVVRNQALLTLGKILSDNDFDQAKIWVSTLPLEKRVFATQGLVHSLVKEDSANALEWVTQLQHEDGYQALLISYVIAANSEGVFEDSLTQLANIENNEFQTRQYTKSLTDWYNVEPEAALEWLNTNEVPKNSRAYTLDIIHTKQRKYASRTSKK